MNLLAVWLSAFFPSWQFFDDVGPTLRLQVRARGEEEWRQAFTPIRRSLKFLIWNPEGNFRHTVNNAVARLAAEEESEVGGFESFRIVRDLSLLALGGRPGEFRIMASDDEVLRAVTE